MTIALKLLELFGLTLYVQTANHIMQIAGGVA